MDLSRYDVSRHDPGANLLKRTLWYGINAIVFDSWLFPFYGIKRLLLRTFGGNIEREVVIKPRVNIKYPWKLTIGAHSWIGEGVWIDSLGSIRIGAHCCLSQGVYLCTGNHNWSEPGFGLMVEPITIADRTWIGAFSIVCPGVSVAEGTVITTGSVVTEDTVPWSIYSGNPASVIKKREISRAQDVPVVGVP